MIAKYIEISQRLRKNVVSLPRTKPHTKLSNMSRDNGSVTQQYTKLRTLYSLPTM